MAIIDTTSADADRIVLTVRDTIEAGDAARMEALVDRLIDEPTVEIAPNVTVAFDSGGGNYEEGIAIGMLLWSKGYGSLVRNDARCYSAAAFAFLGGAYLGVTNGWGPQRILERGGSIGFHSPYFREYPPRSWKHGVDTGKGLVRTLMNYAHSLRIDMTFINDVLARGPDEKDLLKLEKVGDLRQLGITLNGCERATSVGEKEVVFACNYATGWARPIALNPFGQATLAEVHLISAGEFRRFVLTKVTDIDCRNGPISQMIRASLETDSCSINEVSVDAERLGIIPNLQVASEELLYHVSGFDFGGGFYVTDCFVKISNRDTPNLALTIVMIDTASSFSTKSYAHRGDILYEIHSPDEIIA